MTHDPHKERLISGIGGGLAIAVVFGLTRESELALHAQPFLIASMGATAVLLFAVPHGPMSQPWNVLGGHGLSALIGVTMARLLADPVLASTCAAGIAITTMYYLRCLHPPGGATAIIPAISGAGADQFGYTLALFPIGAGAVLMVVIAVIFNLPFAWRRYPTALARYMEAGKGGGETDATDDYPNIRHADFVAALAEIDTFVDISEDDLLHIYDIAQRRSREDQRS